MRRNVKAKEQSQVSPVQDLIVRLSDLGTCTTEARDIGLRLLALRDEADDSPSTQRRADKPTRTSSRASKRTVSATTKTTDNVCSVRDVQRIIKTALSSLKIACKRVPVEGHIKAPPRTTICEGKAQSDLVTIGVLAEICHAALNTWQALSIGLSESVMTIAKTRYNLGARLAEIHDLSRLKVNLTVLHNLLRSQARPPTSRPGTQAAPIASLFSFLEIPLQGEVLSEASFVISVQILVLKSILIDGHRPDKFDLDCLTSTSGPIAWCSHLAATDLKQSQSLLSVVNRLLLKVTASAAADLQTEAVVPVLESMLDEANPEASIILPYLCRTLNHKCIPMAYDRIRRLVLKTLTLFERDPPAESLKYFTVLTDRMTRLAQSLDLGAEAEIWLQKGLKFSIGTSNETCISLDQCTLAISRCPDEASCTECLSQSMREVQMMSPTHLTTAEEISVLTQSLASMRSQILRSWKQFPRTTIASGYLLAALIDSTTTIIHQTSVAPNMLTGLNSTISAMVKTWLSIASTNDSDNLQHFKTQALKIAPLLRRTQLEVDFQGLRAAVFNKAGLRYNAGLYEPAAELLELYFEWDPPTKDTLKQLEYLWSAYLRCHKHEQAASWLRQSIHVDWSSCGQQDTIAPEVATKLSPSLVRAIAKLVVLALEHENIALSGIHTSATVLELQLHHLHDAGSNPRSVTLFEQSFRDLLVIVSERQAGDEQCLRIVSFAVSHYRVWNDLARMRALLTNEEVVKILRTASFVSELSKLFQIRISVHKLLCAPNVPYCMNDLLPELYQLSSKLPTEESATHLNLKLQILSEAADIYSALQQPLNALQLLDCILLQKEHSNVLNAQELMQIHLLAGELALLCGFEFRAASHARLVRESIGMASLSARSLVRLNDLSLRIAIIADAADIMVRVTAMSSVMEGLPRTERFEAQIKSLHGLSRSAEALGLFGLAIVFDLEALSAARQAVTRRQMHSDTLDLEPIVEAMSNLSMSNSHDAESQGVLSLMLTTLMHLGSLYEHCGMIKDALHYRDEAIEAAGKLQDAKLIYQTTVAVASTRVNAGKAILHQNIDIPPESQNLFWRAAQFRVLAGISQETSKEYRQMLLNSSSTLLEEARKINKSLAKNIGTPAAESRKRTASRRPNSGNSDPSTILLDDLQRELDCDLAALLDEAENLEEAQSRVKMLERASSPQCRVCLTLGTIELGVVEKMLSKHAVYGALQESALSLPNICLTLPKTEHSKAKRKAVLSKGKLTSCLDSQALEERIEKVENSITGNFESWLVKNDSRAAQTAGNLFNTFYILHSAIADPSRGGTLAALDCNRILEMARGLAIERDIERNMVESKVRSGPRSQDKLDMLTSSTITSDPVVSVRDFQTQYLDIIPESWSVVSIGLSPGGKELIISRMQAHSCPLLLRLPVSRHASRDVDEETFEYGDAKSELLDIVRQSDTSAQEAKSIKDRNGKAQWWKLRQDLDTRLQTLLENIEHCWLGGFKGVLTGSPADSSMLETFRVAFARIMLKHVPLSKDRVFDLDSRVLDLFVDLGSIAGESSLELLEDLLYFILDIYQFHGESIAYDEIDIDQMVVDVQSALSIYHDTAALSPKEGHLILILDKDLHIFPWESLPFLRGKSVSRVPSIAILKSMLISRPDLNMAVSRSSGSYILNPAGDLKATEKSFQPIFESLEGFSGIVGRKPEEAEFLKYLESSSIFAYFGHGGGEQYVRANKLKMTNPRGVVILMGCSSGALRDQGSFDPWGTPYNYIVAKCPCLVANLWDVTDKDIDRFSLEMLSRWSLTESEHEPVSICSAVALSRDACTLRYLNGAAPVVYGLPLNLMSS